MTAALDAGVSPQAIKLANEYLTDQLEHEAADKGVALDWDRFHAYSKRRDGELRLIQWAPVLR